MTQTRAAGKKALREFSWTSLADPLPPFAGTAINGRLFVYYSHSPDRAFGHVTERRTACSQVFGAGKLGQPGIPAT